MTAIGRTLQFDWLTDLSECQTVPSEQQWVLSIMSRYGHELVSLLWRILGNEQDVCDAYQTTFLHLANLDADRRPRQLRAYAFRSASNVAISMLRSKAAEQRRITAWSQKAESALPEHELDQQELTEQLRYYLGQLPEHLREVVVLRDLAELSYRRIAKMLGITAGSARVYRCKAMQLLAVWMTEPQERYEDVR